MPDLDSLPGIRELRTRTRGDARVFVTVLDGEARIEHPAYVGANVVAHRGYWLDDREAGSFGTAHATHIASIMFGQPGSEVEGLVPDCRGLLLGAGVDEETVEDELGIARAIEFALAQGARIIHCAFCHPSQTGKAQSWIADAVRKAEEYGAVIIAPAGNDYGELWCVPSALPTVLAVGALADDGAPMHFTNFGSRYDGHSIMGPGENVLGASTDGDVVRENGTSVAAPVVTAIIAALTSAVIQAGGPLDPQRVRRVLLETARPCTGAGADRCIGGEVAVDRAIAVLLDGMTVEAARRAFPDGPCAPDAPSAIPEAVAPKTGMPPHSNAVHHPEVPPDPREVYKREERGPAAPGAVEVSSITPSLRYPAIAFVIGSVSVEFPDETTREMFAEAMGSTLVPTDGRLDDVEQLVAHLDQFPADARRLTWVVSLDGEPRYRVRPVGVYAREVFDTLAALVLGSARGEITVASIPGEALDDMTILADGTVVRDLRVASLRGIYGWHPEQVARQSLATLHMNAGAPAVTDLDPLPMVSTDVGRATAEDGSVLESDGAQLLDWPRLRVPASAEVEAAVTDFLRLVYFRAHQEPEVSRERALNFVATNGYQVSAAFLDAMNDGLEYVDHRLEYSPFARVGGSCWDVVLCFRDPEDARRADREYRLTVDVVEPLPVTVGRLRAWAGTR
ncbi:MAG: S8 family serine peptidase [Actinobacteria bacterium]|uniref:Unannotated protein n=1 Tax=freshwater metagenome TaxID=449393 RepID=A0A6J7EY99_9ZZZZ|nr:S8 family serine peptidase [Actinomycetota bacterium]